MTWEDVDWELLARLRDRFLSPQSSGPDYWTSERVLEQYDFTFGQRIAWKWDAVLEDAAERGWRPPEAYAVVDWGCGTGVASRRFIARFPSPGARSWPLDRSRLAQAWTAAHIPIPPAESIAGPFCLLVSHVALELSNADRGRLLELAERAHTIFWVEPGTPEAGRLLVQARERLRKHLVPFAPCPHSSACGLLAPERASDWCHHFAAPAPETFTSAGWSVFSRRLGIDLRALPVSYLAMTRDPLPPHAGRVLGRPRALKGRVEFLACREGGITDERVIRSRDRELHDRLASGGFSLWL